MNVDPITKLMQRVLCKGCACHGPEYCSVALKCREAFLTGVQWKEADALRAIQALSQELNREIRAYGPRILGKFNASTLQQAAYDQVAHVIYDRETK